MPGALIIERNNLEWRLDPAGSHRIPEAENPIDRWSSSARRVTPPAWPPPAWSSLGRTATTDLDGGFAAWKRAGLPTTPGSRD